MLIPALLLAPALATTATNPVAYPLPSVDAVDTMTAKVSALLMLDDQLLDIGRRLAKIEEAVDYLDDIHNKRNPYNWTPHRPTLRDRKRALRSARAQITATMTDTWPTLDARRPPN